MLPGSGGGRSLTFNGHIDVVPVTPEHHWTHDPWGAEIADGRMYGRGAADMKSGVVAMLGAVRVLRDAGLRGDIRYFRQLSDISPFDGLDLGDFSFWRSTVGVSLGF